MRGGLGQRFSHQERNGGSGGDGVERYETRALRDPTRTFEVRTQVSTDAKGRKGKLRFVWALRGSPRTGGSRRRSWITAAEYNTLWLGHALRHAEDAATCGSFGVVNQNGRYLGEARRGCTRPRGRMRWCKQRPLLRGWASSSSAKRLPGCHPFHKVKSMEDKQRKVIEAMVEEGRRRVHAHCRHR